MSWNTKGRGFWLGAGGNFGGSGAAGGDGGAAGGGGGAEEGPGGVSGHNCNNEKRKGFVGVLGSQVGGSLSFFFSLLGIYVCYLY